MNPNLPSPPSVGAGPTPQESMALAVAALILGCLALGSSFLLVGALFGLAGLIVGILHLARRRSFRGMALAGTILSGLGILCSAALAVIYLELFRSIAVSEDSRMFGSGSGRVTREFADWEGVQAPDLVVQTIDGQEIRLSQLQGRRVVLDFWATWCPPCVKEIPHFSRLHRETSRDQLVILGISDEDEDTLRKFVKKHQVPYPVGRAVELPSPYKDISAIPTTFFIDRKGIIQEVLVGYHDFNALRERALAADSETEPRPPPR